jgi:hypothetical protein
MKPSIAKVQNHIHGILSILVYRELWGCAAEDFALTERRYLRDDDCPTSQT